MVAKQEEVLFPALDTARYGENRRYRKLFLPKLLKSHATGMAVAQAKTFIDDYFARYPKIKSFIDETITQARRDGFVRTMLGRRRDLPEINSRSMNRRQFSRADGG